MRVITESTNLSKSAGLLQVLRILASLIATSALKAFSADPSDQRFTFT